LKLYNGGKSPSGDKSLKRARQKTLNLISFYENEGRIRKAEALHSGEKSKL
jgi:hypothetical protein